MCIFLKRATLVFNFVAMMPTVLYVNGLTFSISQWNACGHRRNIIIVMPYLSIDDCVFECAMRPECMALNYRRRMKFCELLRVDAEVMLYEQCIYITRSDILVLKVPCNQCQPLQKCDFQTVTCFYHECTLPSIVNGTLLGNTAAIGRKIRVRCYDGYDPLNGATNAMCLETGLWSHTLDCVLAETGTEGLVPIGTSAEPETTTASSAGSCVSIDLNLATHDWCIINCNHVPPFCPTDICSCS